MQNQDHAPESQGRLLARLLRVLLARESFDDVGDLTDALKRECARLRIGWTNDDINDAYRLIGSNRAIPGQRLELDPRPGPEDVPPVTRAEAAAILQRLGVRGVPTMRAIRPLDADDIARRQWLADRRTAYRQIEALILETAKRADELEARANEIEAALETEADHGR